jgi:nascent polypeptide-associated complex subunit alpha
MFGNDPKKVEQMMKKLNITTKSIDATEVVIKSKDGNIVIDSPEVMIMNMMGRDVYQITGKAKKGVKDEDVRMVMEHTGKDKVTVEKKLEELNNDLAKTIMELKKD